MNTRILINSAGLGATYSVTAIAIFVLLLPMFSLERISLHFQVDTNEQNVFAQDAGNEQGAGSQANRPETTAGNVTATIKPQGTALDVENVTSMTDRPEATAGNVTATIKPQGTTLDVENVTSMEDRPEATAGNVTATIKPQGTALGDGD